MIDLNAKERKIRNLAFRWSAVLRIGIMTAAGILSCLAGAGCKYPWPWPDGAESVPAEASLDIASPSDAERISERSVPETVPDEKPEIEEDEGPSPTKLNMAFMFPEGSTDPSESYAGTVFKELNHTDTQWISQIYSNSATTPANMASHLGKGQIPETIDEWTRVNVTFYDGDGTPVSSYSNVKEILSLASVYAYYEGIESQEEFRSYARKLWDNSHRYSVSMSDVYYCDGECLLEDPEQEREAEDIPQEISLTGSSAANDGTDGSQNSGEQTSDVSSETGTSDPAKETSASAGGPSTGPGAEMAASAETNVGTETAASVGANVGADTSASAEANVGTEATETAGTTTSAEMAVSPETAASAGTTASPETIALAETTALAETAVSPGTTALTEPTAPADTAAAAGPGSSETEVQTAEADGQKEESVASPKAPEQVLEGPGGGPGFSNTTGNADSSETPPETAAVSPENVSQETTAASENAVQETTSVSEEASSEGVSLEGVSSDGITSDGASADAKKPDTCPGHVDLNIRATIVGLNGSKNLYSIDSVGSSEEHFTESWQGWSDEAIEYTHELDDQDWYAEYGLTLSDGLYIRNPLTDSEIQRYMSLIPEGTSESRKALALQALRSVGRIPYYWGGKPNGPGFEHNNFGSVIPSDHKGRVLKGLDCSGWIAWVYWTSLGMELPYQSTGGLNSLGTGIDRSSLRTGDIILKTGQDAHVFMFLAWADGNSMYLIHETGGLTNNVTVGIYNVDWPYNRNLIND